ncbi:ABC transporter substrate-binding protein [Cellulosilyticum ruminicola]|uniref:ABC transporter substrate-binding protein n=1 Tax=Cellulosilyticum ruminicola TaxID=425254 RepID=UPI0006CFB78D|nr:ABC transporter substrate-binding protein [Cellulosilyticum ruminicola]
MGKKFLGALLSMAMVSMLMVGCGGGQPAATNTNAPEGDTAAAEETTSAGGDGDLITVGFSQVGAESDWRVANTQSMKESLSEANGFELIFADAQQKQENQIKAVRDFISQEVDVIVIAPVTETGWETVLGEAKDAEIPVIVVDRQLDVSDDSLYTCWVGSDFYQEGINAVDWLTKYMDGLGRGEEDLNVAVLQGTIGSSAEIGRTKGVRDELEKHSNYKIVAEQTGEFTQAKGQEVMESFLKSGEDIDILIAQNDNMAFGAIDALKAVGKDPGEDVVIVSFDAVKAAFDSMIAGDMNVSVECNPLHGPRVAELAKKIMNGEEVEKIQYVEEGVYPADTAAETLPSRAY